MIDTSLTAQIACVRREIMRRADEYPELIANRQLLPAQAAREEAQMTAVLQTLTNLQYSRPNQAEALQPQDVSHRQRRPARA